MGIEPTIRVLQTLALPLGDDANASKNFKSGIPPFLYRVYRAAGQTVAPPRVDELREAGRAYHLAMWPFDVYTLVHNFVD